MSEDIFDDSDEIQFDHNDSELRLLSREEFLMLAREIICNEDYADGTSLCYEFFCKIMSNSIQNNSFEDDYSQLNILLKCINRLKAIDKFDAIAFTTLLLNEFIIVPLEVVWWLQENQIMYLSQYCDMKNPVNLANDLLTIVEKNSSNETFPVKEIIQTLLTELIRGCHRPNLGICRLYRSYTWSQYCVEVLNDIIEVTLTAVLKEDDKPFINCFPYLKEARRYVPSIIFKQLYKNILTKIVCYNVKEFDLYSAYIYQQLWCSDQINKNVLMLYETIFTQYCNMQHILEIMEEHEDDINWKLTLIAVGVCAQNCSTGIADVKDIAFQFLNDSFKGGKIKHFIKSILFIRQGCMEKNMKMDYRTWYSNIFGSNSDFKTTNNQTLFKFFINSLTKMIPYEPKSYLKIQIDQGILAPPKCNVLVHDYKYLCRARLEELKQSPCISIGKVQVLVLHMVEESCRNDCISPIMLDVILNQKNSFYNVIVPQILRNKLPFTKVRELLVQNKYLTEELLHFSRADNEGKLFDEDDDDFNTQ